ncbi:hypothetical protein [Deefgea rivuli]|uniref:hypothetical protein n=1 Tax=Deefgea rivuli TaxID=400948 RepID=UPI000481A560|nr:hypothetical protein [Deefgea rivuli]
MKIAVLSALLLSSALHAATPPPECVAASKALDAWITQQHGQIRLSDLEISPLADDVRMACDGTPQAYQKTLAQIMQPWQPASTSEPFAISETAQAMLGMAFIIGLGAVSAGTLVVLYQGAAGIAILADDFE